MTTYSPGLGQAGSSNPTFVKVENSSGTVINPATEDTLLKIPGLSIPIYDYVAVTYPVATTEVYTFKTGGSGGSTVATVTLVFTDSTKASLSTVTKT